jgi:hypothetical protein
LKAAIELALVSACVLTSCTRRREPANERNQSTPLVTSAGKSSNTESLHGSSSRAGSDGALVPAAPYDTLLQTSTSGGSGDFQCAPGVFTLRDTITLRMEHPHGEYLQVTQPDGTPFFLAYPNPTEPASYFLVSSEAFAQMPTIRFKANVRSRPRIAGRDTLERVFDKPGKYVVTVGHRLETERGSDITRCTIRLVSAR